MFFILLGAIPVLILLGLLGLAVFCLFTEKKRSKNSEQPYYNHPDKDMPLYNRGHCDRYSAGTFYW